MFIVNTTFVQACSFIGAYLIRRNIRPLKMAATQDILRPVVSSKFTDVSEEFTAAFIRTSLIDLMLEVSRTSETCVNV